MTRVLIVDDHDDNLYYLEALLSASGFEVERAHHGVEALAAARQRRPDLVVSDLLMPVMDGFTLLREWKADQTLAPIHFIVYTATYTSPEDERLAMDLGADAFVLKPAEPDDLLARVRRVLGGPPARASVTSGAPPGVEATILQDYSHALIRKLEQKSAELEATNRALREEMDERRASLESLQQQAAQIEQQAAMLRIAGRAARLGGWTLQLSDLDLTWSDENCAIHDVPPGYKPTLDEGINYYLPEHRDLVRRYVATCAADGTPYDFELPIVTPTGRQLWVRSIGEAVRDADGKIVRLQGAFQDISERKRAEVVLREQAELLDKARDAILVRDMEQHVRFWNRSAERLYGWSAAEAVGRPVTELFYPDPAAFTVATQFVLERGEWIGEMEQRTKSGATITVEGRWTLVRDDNGKATSILAINTDITHRKQLEQQFIRAQRLESIGTLAGGIAHDLNNVLTPIVMSIELLKQTVDDPSSVDTLNLIEASARRGAEMVSQVLSFARGVEGRRIRVQVGDTVRDAMKIAADTFPKNITINERLQPDLDSIEADPTQLHQVLLNLMVNARDAMPDGGFLTISAENVLVDQQFAALNLNAQEGPHVKLAVEDTGSGIAREHLDKIFDPFFTTKEFGKGTGLGLATSLAIVSGHGGFVRVQSEPGQGSRFSVFLPSLPAREMIQASEVGVDYPRGNGETVLVVDDEAAIRRVTQLMLESFGYRVLVAADGAEAIALYARHEDEVQVVITDMMMPVMDGAATAEALHTMNPRLPIIGASGLVFSGTTDGTMSRGLTALLPKPYTTELLLRTVQRALAEAS